MKKLIQELFQLLEQHAYIASPERKELASARLRDHEAYLRGESTISPYRDKDEWFKHY